MAKSKIKDYIYSPEFECMTRTEMENLQSERLRKTVELVYNNCKPYRAKMDEFKIKPSDIKSVSDLSKLPFTVKHDLREAYPFGFYSSPSRDIVEVHASSGTTGKPITCGYTRADLDNWSTCIARILTMAGATDEDIFHVAFGYGLFTGGRRSRRARSQWRALPKIRSYTSLTATGCSRAAWARITARRR